MKKPTVAVAIGTAHYNRMFSPEAWQSLDRFAHVIHHPKDEPANKQELTDLLAQADGCISSWGVARFDADVLAAAPQLQALAHMGSSVKRFISDAFWERGIHLTSAGVTLARDVAETTLGLMIVGQKRIIPLSRHVSEGGWRASSVWDKWHSRELFRSQIGIIGASNVGRYLIELLQPFEASIMVYDPFINRDEAAQLGAEKVELDTLLKRADIVSLHAPSNAHTHHMLNQAKLKLMKDDALLINTARGTLIDESALITELQQGRFFAFLDVTDPEPPAAGNPLLTLDNVIVTPHIAGCIEKCHRMGELAVEELRRFFAGKEAIHQITPEMVERIA